MKIFKFFISLSLLYNCSRYEKNQIQDIVKLSSPNKQYDVYLYNIESGMSFGSNVPALQIVKHQEKPDFYNGDFFRISNSIPFQIRWNNDNLIVKTINHNVSKVDSQPIKTEINKYKGITIKNMSYTFSSTTAISDFRFNNFYNKKGYLVFKNESDSLILNEANTQFFLDSNFVEVRYFELNKIEKTKGISLNAYKLIPQNNFDFNKLKQFQPLEKIKE